MVDYNEYMKSPEWAAIRQQVLQRAGGECERCGEHAPLSVHHRHYDDLGCEDPVDLEALCESCHEEADEERAAETQERLDTRWQNRLEAWGTAIYGPNWQQKHDELEVEQKFIEYLDDRGEGDDIPDDRR